MLGMHLRDWNKEDLHKKPLFLFLKVISVCMHVVFTCVCACACACSLAAVWVCRSMRLSWDFAGPLTDSLLSHLSFGFCINTSLRLDLVSRMIPFPPQVCRWCSMAKCDNGGNMTQKKTAGCTELKELDLTCEDTPPQNELTAFIDYSDGVNELTLKGTEGVSFCLLKCLWIEKWPCRCFFCMYLPVSAIFLAPWAKSCKPMMPRGFDTSGYPSPHQLP